jgi:hypothetical protein
MRIKSTSFVLAACLLAAAPAVAGNLTLDNGHTTWHSTQCSKPMGPGSVMGAKSDTAGDDMNSLMGQHNAFVDATQAYMNCIADEASQDQTLVDQTIVAGAQKNIADAQADLDNAAPGRK